MKLAIMDIIRRHRRKHKVLSALYEYKHLEDKIVKMGTESHFNVSMDAIELHGRTGIPVKVVKMLCTSMWLEGTIEIIQHTHYKITQAGTHYLVEEVYLNRIWYRNPILLPIVISAIALVISIMALFQ